MPKKPDWNAHGARERLRAHLRELNRLRGGNCDLERRALQQAIAVAGFPDDPCRSKAAFNGFMRRVFGKAPLARKDGSVP